MQGCGCEHVISLRMYRSYKVMALNDPAHIYLVVVEWRSAAMCRGGGHGVRGGQSQSLRLRLYLRYLPPVTL